MNFPVGLQNEAAVGNKGASCSISSHASVGLEAALVQVASVMSCRYQLLHRNSCSNGDGTGGVKALNLASAALATF